MSQSSASASASASSSASTRVSLASTTAVSSRNLDLWPKFYIQACVLQTTTRETLLDDEEKTAESKKPSDEELTKLHQRIMITLDTTTKLIFGLGATKKSQVVVHGDGAIELIVGLVYASKVLKDPNATPLSKPIILSSLKAIKTCVLRNPAGRCRCRSANVFSFFKDILNVILDGSGDDTEKKEEDLDAILVELVFTTLAACCLGDDLNALQASTQFKPVMERTKATFSVESDEYETSLDQKLQYLEKLFAAIEKEQSELLTFLEQNKSSNSSVYDEFIQNSNDSEINIRKGYSNLQLQNHEESLKQYNESLNLITPYIEYTKLFNPLLIEIRMKRAQVYFELKNLDECVVDTTYLLEQERLGESAPMASVTILKLHSKALAGVGRNDEARESLGKLSILCPEDQEVTKMMKDLKL